jgi:hypothetical protein
MDPVIFDLIRENAGSGVILALLIYIWKNHLAHIQASLNRLEHDHKILTTKIDKHLEWHLDHPISEARFTLVGQEFVGQEGP